MLTIRNFASLPHRNDVNKLLSDEQEIKRYLQAVYTFNFFMSSVSNLRLGCFCKLTNRQKFCFNSATDNFAHFTTLTLQHTYDSTMYLTVQLNHVGLTYIGGLMAQGSKFLSMEKWHVLFDLGSPAWQAECPAWCIRCMQRAAQTAAVIIKVIKCVATKLISAINHLA